MQRYLAEEALRRNRVAVQAARLLADKLTGSPEATYSGRDDLGARTLASYGGRPAPAYREYTPPIPAAEEIERELNALRQKVWVVIGELEERARVLSDRLDPKLCEDCGAYLGDDRENEHPHQEFLCRRCGDLS